MKVPAEIVNAIDQIAKRCDATQVVLALLTTRGLCSEIVEKPFAGRVLR
jgi:hypothetical protein